VFITTFNNNSVILVDRPEKPTDLPQLSMTNFVT